MAPASGVQRKERKVRARVVAPEEWVAGLVR